VYRIVDCREQYLATVIDMDPRDYSHCSLEYHGLRKESQINILFVLQ
jgi:hypothetical protein